MIAPEPAVEEDVEDVDNGVADFLNNNTVNSIDNIRLNFDLNFEFE